MLDRLSTWLRAGRGDLQVAHQRRLSAAYKQRSKRTKTIWLIAAILMLVNPELPFIVIVGLVSTLLSFAILDEDS